MMPSIFFGIELRNWLLDEPHIFEVYCVDNTLLVHLLKPGIA